MAQRIKHLPAMRETRVQSLGWEDPLDKEMATHSRILPGESHGQRSLAGYSPRGRKESDTTERVHFTSLHNISEQFHFSLFIFHFGFYCSHQVFLFSSCIFL